MNYTALLTAAERSHVPEGEPRSRGSPSSFLPPAPCDAPGPPSPSPPLLLPHQDEDLLGDDYIGRCTVSLAQAREAGADRVQAAVYDKDGQEQGFVICGIVWKKVGAEGVVQCHGGLATKCPCERLSPLTIPRHPPVAVWGLDCKLAVHDALHVLYHLANAGRGFIRPVVR